VASPESDPTPGEGAQPERDCHEHVEAEIDEVLEESFPSSDPPSTWAGGSRSKDE
jgi:hypothetical protein